MSAWDAAKFERGFFTISSVAFVSSLLLLHGAVVIDEDEGALVLGIGVTLRALVARAEVALRVVVRQSSLGGALLGASIENDLSCWLFCAGAPCTYCQGRLVR